MQITFATKKIDGQYEAALVIDNKFTRAASGRSLTDLLLKLIGPILSQDMQDGTEVSVRTEIATPAEIERINASEKRERETAQANAEAAEIEKLTLAVQREKSAREAALVEANIAGGTGPNHMGA